MKERSYKTLKNALDVTFSKYIRLRDADENGICKCISCGKPDHWKNMDAGHFVNRKHLSLRWGIRNVHAQCKSCNRFDEGNIVGYTKAMIKKYGTEILDEFELRKHTPCQIARYDLEVLIDFYKEEIKIHFAHKIKN